MLEEIQNEIHRLSERRAKSIRDGKGSGNLDARIAELYEMKRARLAGKAVKL